MKTSRESHALWKLFMRAHKAVMSKLAERMEEVHGIPLTWFDVLGQLGLAGGRLRMTELANSVFLSTSGLTRLLDRMERDGLLVREPCKHDRRGYWATLTPKGRRMAKRTLPSHVKCVQESFFDHIEPSNVEILRQTLWNILEAHGQGPRE